MRSSKTGRGPADSELEGLREENQRLLARVGELERRLSSSYNLTQERRPEQALGDIEELWTRTLEGACDGLWEWNAQTDRIHHSKQWMAILGHEEDLIGDTFAEWEKRIHPEDRTRSLQELRAHLSGETAGYSREHRVHCKDGKYKWILERGAIVTLGSDGNPRRAIGTSCDITERKHGEAERETLKSQLAQAQKMESVGRWAASAVHDFNNLITVILHNTALALTKLAKSGYAHGRLLEIEHAGQQASALTRQLLVYSRKHELHASRLRLNDAIRDVRTILECLMGEDVEVRLLLTVEDTSINMNPHQLEQVIMNLAINARDAMPDGGNLTIETTITETAVPAGGDRDWVVLKVSDTGVGMTEHVKKRIFEPFYTTKDEGKGTGLGLSMVNGVVAESGGTVHVTSVVGRGTAFHIHLPRVRLPQSADASSVRLIAPHRRPTILVVGAQSEVRNYVGDILRSYGYRVLLASDASEALGICERSSLCVDLVLTELAMPDIDGLALADLISGLWPKVRIVFMSGDCGQVVEGRTDRASNRRFLQKPFSHEQLAAVAVQALLDCKKEKVADVLIVDDFAPVRGLLAEILQSAGFVVTEAADDTQALDRMREDEARVVIVDQSLGDKNGWQVAQQIKTVFPAASVVVMSAAFIETRIGRADAGIDGVLAKTATPEELVRSVCLLLANAALTGGCTLPSFHPVHSTAEQLPTGGDSFASGHRASRFP